MQRTEVIRFGDAYRDLAYNMDVWRAGERPAWMSSHQQSETTNQNQEG